MATRKMPKKGDRVQVVRYSLDYNGRHGKVFSTDGSYVYVLIDESDTEPSHIIEVFMSELELLG